MEPEVYDSMFQNLFLKVKKVMRETGLPFSTVFRIEFKKSEFDEDEIFLVKSAVWRKINASQQQIESDSVDPKTKVDKKIIYLIGSIEMSIQAGEDVCPLE